MGENSNSNLSPEIFEKFLAEKLEIPNWRSILKESKLKLMEQIVFGFARNIYFQNITWSACPMSARKIPVREEAIDVVIRNGSGGCCVHNNYGLLVLLQFLGLKSHLVGVFNPIYPHVAQSHAIVVVHIPAEDEEGRTGNPDDIGIYAIDVGFSRRIPHIMPLHKLPFRSKIAGFEFEVRYNPDSGKYERILFEGCSGFGKLKESENGQRLDMTFDLIPRPFEYFDDAMSLVFIDPTSRFMKTAFINRMTRIESFDDFNYVTCLRKSIIEGSRDEFKQTTFATYQEMQPIIEKHFPDVDKEELRTSLRKFDEYEEEQKLNQ